MEGNYKVYSEERSGERKCESFFGFAKAYERYVELKRDVGEGKPYRSVWLTASMEKVLESYHGQKMARNGFYTMHEWSNGMEDFEDAED